ncbi:hypothetical protein WN51_07810 [Melipona quadrifasciata]|uniref:Uncharacterized protein n=1 Tax=Melipona quadrifasciata TaxID=166423 RepID=A0A0M9A907_9HYME|nr:hypothetical protein WN51_07810 [Melipona quadrifasciata]
MCTLFHALQQCPKPQLLYFNNYVAVAFIEDFINKKTDKRSLAGKCRWLKLVDIRSNSYRCMYAANRHCLWKFRSVRLRNIQIVRTQQIVFFTNKLSNKVSSSNALLIIIRKEYVFLCQQYRLSHSSIAMFYLYLANNGWHAAHLVS